MISVDGESLGSGVTASLVTPETGDADAVIVDVLNVYPEAVGSGDVSAGGGSAGDSTGVLAWTGSEPGRIVAVGLAFVAAGAAVLMAHRAGTGPVTSAE